MIFILPLVLEAALVDNVIVDDDRVAHLHGVVGVRLMRGSARQRAGVQIAVLGLGPEAIARGEGVLRAQLPIDARRGVVANAAIQEIDAEVRA
jgi:hypothetical protein